MWMSPTTAMARGNQCEDGLSSLTCAFHVVVLQLEGTNLPCPAWLWRWEQGVGAHQRLGSVCCCRGAAACAWCRALAAALMLFPSCFLPADFPTDPVPPAFPPS